MNLFSVSITHPLYLFTRRVDLIFIPYLICIAKLACKSIVINPPTDIDDFNLKKTSKEFYLVLGQLTHYKRADLVVDAFLKTDKKLVVIGDGEQLQTLKKRENSRIKIMGRQNWEICKKYLGEAKALIFPGVEDFGMVPVEANACGTPVICFAQGGAKETIVDKLTGVYFHEQSAEAIINAVNYFEENYSDFNTVKIRSHACNFNKQRFEKEIKDFINTKYSDFLAKPNI